MREEDVETPALLLDLDAFEQNLALMAQLLAPNLLLVLQVVHIQKMN
jgi:D-serine deaminase-like pyridoxal phosphate-dependent protein